MMNLELERTRVHCDECGNEFEATNPVHEYLNQKCEKCGSVLVTQDDIDTHNAIGEFAEMINNIFGVIQKDKAKRVGRISINTNSKTITLNNKA